MYKKIFRFIIVGGVSTALNYAIFYVLFTYNISGYLLASGIGYVAGVLLGYSLNKKRTFESTQAHSISLLGKYISVYLLTLLIGLGCIYVLVDLLHISPLIGQLFSLVVTTASNYMLLHIFVFGRNEKSNS